MIDQGMIVPDDDGRLTAGAIRRIGLLASLFRSGVPDSALAHALRTGRLSLGFLESPAFEHFSALTSTTFRELSRERGVPVGLLLAIREAIGSAVAEPDDSVREIELSMVPLIEAELAVGYPEAAVERLIRTLGESLRRYVQAEADAFRDHV